MFIIKKHPVLVLRLHGVHIFYLAFRFGEQFPARIFRQLGEWNGVQ
jgi:hypothetical protein